MLCLPIRSGRGRNVMADAYGAAAWACPEEDAAADGFRVTPSIASTSVLPFTFNILWSGALNARRGGVTHFAMQHDDIVPDRGWLDVLLKELDSTGADVVSAIVPIKDSYGLTSTALDTGDVWAPRRLTMTEVCERPETFTDPDLLVNTGLWVCDLRKPWTEKISFRQQDQIIQHPDGEFAPQMRPEDWDFSRQVRALGGTLYATRKVGLFHELPQWHNRHPWGSLKTDHQPDNRLQFVK